MKTRLFGFLMTAATASTGLASNDVLVVESGARAPQKGLKMKASRVPTFAIHEAKGKIPRLAIGQEAVLRFDESRTVISFPEVPKVPLSPRSSPKSPAVVQIPKKMKAPMTAKTSEPRPATAAAVLPALPEFSPVVEPSLSAAEVQAKAVRPLSADEIRLLQAQIIHRNLGHADIALGLLAPLMSQSKVSVEASVSYAEAARELGLSSEFRTILLKLAQDRKNKAAAVDALERIVSQAQTLEIPDLALIQKLVETHGIDVSKHEAYNFARAKYFLEAGDLTQVTEALKLVPDKSALRADTLLVSALMAYRTDRLEQAVTDLEALLQLPRLASSVESLGALTLARIRFQRSEYDAANKAYLRVNKDNPLWLQAMTERAWVQILLKDNEGAAGNMFSLHTDFFKNTFAPDSYTVRSMAYLNLCQFGDGYQTLKNLARRYGPLAHRIEKFRATHSSPDAVLDSVRNWLRDPKSKEAHLPGFLVMELARHPSYLRPQTRMNLLEDEKEAFNKASLSLIQKERDLIQARTDARKELEGLKERAADRTKANADSFLRIQALEKRIESLSTQYELAKIARQQMREARTQGLARIDAEKDDLRKTAAKALTQRLAIVHGELVQALEQNEVLQYEILAGAGEHLRAQSAGADTVGPGPDRRPAAQDRMTWKFKGEIWEDEVGHYRSSLKNVCPQTDQIAAH